MKSPIVFNQSETRRWISAGRFFWGCTYWSNSITRRVSHRDPHRRCDAHTRKWGRLLVVLNTMRFYNSSPFFLPSFSSKKELTRLPIKGTEPAVDHRRRRSSAFGSDTFSSKDPRIAKDRKFKPFAFLSKNQVFSRRTHTALPARFDVQTSFRKADNPRIIFFPPSCSLLYLILSWIIGAPEGPPKVKINLHVDAMDLPHITFFGHIQISLQAFL